MSEIYFSSIKKKVITENIRNKLDYSSLKKQFLNVATSQNKMLPSLEEYVKIKNKRPGQDSNLRPFG